MKEQFAIVKKEDNAPVRQDRNTGLLIIDDFTSSGGFNYLIGIRQFGDLTIVEDVAQGTAVTYLNGIRVFDGEKQLIIDIPVENNTHYSREAVRQLVMRELLDMLEKATKKEGKNYDRTGAQRIIDEKLEEAYYKQSYALILEWAQNIGIELNA
jgi:hypothetical protein